MRNSLLAWYENVIRLKKTVPALSAASKRCWIRRTTKF